MNFKQLHEQGGAAFPQPIHHPDMEVFAGSGMSLRDYIAVKALAALINATTDKCVIGENCAEANSNFSRSAYAIADSMLQERRG